MPQDAATTGAPAAEEEPVVERDTSEVGRVRLDRDRILAAAEAIADAEGVGKLTMRRLGAELGADPTALYRHFRNKAELLVELADRLFGRTAPLDPTQSWREQFMHQMRFGLDRYRRHPELAVLLAQQPDDTPSLQRLMDQSLGLLAKAGLTPEEAGPIYQTVENHVVGSGLYYAFTEGHPEFRLDHVPGLRRSLALLPEDEFPHLTKAAPHMFPSLDEAFDRGSELIADHIERIVAAKGGSTPPHDGGETT